MDPHTHTHTIILVWANIAQTKRTTFHFIKATLANKYKSSEQKYLISLKIAVWHTEEQFTQGGDCGKQGEGGSRYVAQQAVNTFLLFVHQQSVSQVKYLWMTGLFSFIDTYTMDWSNWHQQENVSSYWQEKFWLSVVFIFNLHSSLLTSLSMTHRHLLKTQ